eukprot:CAMPEP_0197669386 /NCGR_PEP_ID=MMETSP1338-20131121/71823_1 /TAXON_ID=43686 ORGANISM="Pelagodinium beii, Strain RCC1491" /NCGR_SAMPLE_ID=MMETSP1338 /ASSEMBLY_ACC=CAM_ASM_000754 /LENGTH=324 /DNA_ID=CAMNT_0043248937 /DNA_START=207 /DNA_END=1181 /DNA_ORIENTATION=+
MARRCGGSISEVLLWPFGGICFTTRPQGRSPREKLVDDLYIVAAGPATHFPMGAAWVLLLAGYAAACSHVVTAPAWKYLVPFGSAMGPCMNPNYPGCFSTWSGFLCYSFLTQAVQLNVMLFMFNVFFPMYPMDGAKLIVCSLQLFCGASARCAAKVLIGTSIPLAVFFIGHTLMGIHGGGLQPGITMYMGFMCLAESYKIYRLYKEEKLYTHPLFEQARSDTTRINDGGGPAARLNTEQRDDPEAGTSQVQFSEMRAFSGAGRTLAGSYEAPSLNERPPDAARQASSDPAGRRAWLDRVEHDMAHKAKTVRELEDEQLSLTRRE